MKALLVLLALAAACVPAGPPNAGPVTRVVDGDTIDVRLPGGTVRVRLTGIDTPEVYGGVECYGRAASARARELLEGERVRLTYDAELLDRYGRTLAYVFRERDDLFVNLALVEEGYAQVLTIPPNVAHTDRFVAAARAARAAGLGLWSACEG